MGRTKEADIATRAQVIALMKQNLSQVAISNAVQRSRRFVQETIKRFLETGSYQSRKRSGRPSLSTPRTDRVVRRAVLKSPHKTAPEILKAVGNSFVTPPSYTTMKRILHTRLKLPARRPAHKPLLNVVQRRKRLDFCRTYRNWTPEQWEKVLFSDESSFQLWKGGQQYVRRPPGQRFNPLFTIPTVKKSESLMIWGCFGAAGRGRLHFVEKGVTINAARYIEILKDKLHLAMTISKTTVFQQDNAPCHAAATVRRYFATEGVEVLDWPGNSPDLNPIENLWCVMKRRVRAKCPKTIQDLKRAILEVWVKEINENYCKTLVHSMPRRIEAVIRNKGYPTKY